MSLFNVFQNKRKRDPYNTDKGELSTGVCIFKKHYNIVTSLVEVFDDYYTDDVQNDIAPLLWVICDYAAATAKKDRLEIMTQIDRRIKYNHLMDNEDFFRKRVDFYASFIRGRTLRGECVDFAKLPDYPSMVLPAIAFCDCMVNPECCDNYEEAPVIIGNAFVKFDFKLKVVIPMIDEATALFKDIYDNA